MIQVIFRAAIVLTVGWTIAMIGVGWVLMPDRTTLQVALNKPWTAPVSDLLCDDGTRVGDVVAGDLEKHWIYRLSLRRWEVDFDTDEISRASTALCNDRGDYWHLRVEVAQRWADHVTGATSATDKKVVVLGVAD